MSDATAGLPSPPLLRPTAPTAWIVVTLLLAVNGPLFLCMPLTDDTTLYDLQAMNVMQGGVMYRDIFEPNLPGVVWLHVAIRSLLGTSSIAMRAADLFFFATVVWLLTRWLRVQGRSAAAQGWLAAVLFLFYLSISEWCHCQRDTWMLMPALAALHLRRRQIDRLTAGDATRLAAIRWAILEGVIWGAGVWIKPLIMVPALACWLVSAIHIRKPRILFDLAGLLAGGVTIGLAGTCWLVSSGAWPAFYETWTQWNPQYLAARSDHWTSLRFLGMIYRLSPWMLIHLVAIPVSLGVLLTSFQRLFESSASTARDATSTQSLLAALYLGWIIESFFLQHLFDYVHVPSLLLAMAVLAAAPRVLVERRQWQVAVIGFLGLAALSSPLLQTERIRCWATCVNEGSTPAVRNRLSHFDHPNWEDMQRVAVYLQQQKVGDGELTCFNNNLIHLYTALNLRPSSRYVYLETLLVFFPERRQRIYQSLAETKQRYLVTDLARIGLTPLQLEAIVPGKPLPEDFPQVLKKRTPFANPIVFRAGNIAVHRVGERTSNGTPELISGQTLNHVHRAPAVTSAYIH